MARDRRVLQFLWFKKTPDGKALTGFRAVKVGTTMARVQRHAAQGEPATTLQVIVSVPCHRHSG